MSSSNNSNNYSDHLMSSSDQGGDDEEGDPVAKAEEDFWSNISQARKDFAAKEKKREEASGVTKSQPTPIPEEGVEPSAMNEAKPEVCGGELYNTIHHFVLLGVCTCG